MSHQTTQQQASRDAGADRPRTALIYDSGWAASATLAALFGAIWLIDHGYSGLYHDARLYALQSLANLRPDMFANDLFLAYGSQDQFTLFTKAVAPLIPLVGVGTLVLALSVVGSLLWIVLAIVLSRRLLLDSIERRLGVFFLLVLPSYYGAMEIFAAGRALATPRVFAESLVVLALIVWTSRTVDVDVARQPSLHRLLLPWVGAGLCLLIAAALHPLMAMAGVLTLALVWCLEVKRLLLGALAAGLGALLLAALSLSGIAPFDRLLQRFDPQWLAVIEVRSEHLFLGGWEPRDWSRAAFLSVMSLAGARILGGWRARWAVATVCVAGLGVVLNGVGADLLNNVLLTQLQFFRLTWLLHVIGPLMMGVVLAYGLADWRKRQGALSLLGLSCALAWAGIAPIQTVVSIALAVLGSVFLFQVKPPPLTQQRWLIRLAWLLSLVLLVVLGFTKVQNALQGLDMVEFRLGAEIVYARSFPCLAFGVLSLPMLFVAVKGVGRSAVSVSAVGLLLVSLALFDQRLAVSVVAEQREAHNTLGDLVPEGKLVYWQNEVVMPWFLLQRPSYVTQAQAAGVVFNRDTALEYARRLSIVGSWDEDFHELHPEAPTQLPSGERARAVCRDRDDMFALAMKGKVRSGSSEVGEAETLEPARTFSAPGVVEHYVYLCSDLLESR